MFDIIRKVGHEIVAWDEEALVRAPDAQYWERRLSAGTVQKVSAIVAWGPDDARVFREYPGYAGAPIYITGNPRVDMMRREVRSFYDEEVETIRERFGRFVLINTNFGWNNHFIPNFAQINNAGKPMDGFMASLVAHRTAIFEHFKKMVPALAEALPDFTILVRPHPTESHVPWNEIAGRFGNLKVVHEGNVIPWLMACEALVHNSCTTPSASTSSGGRCARSWPESRRSTIIPVVGSGSTDTSRRSKARWPRSGWSTCWSSPAMRVGDLRVRVRAGISKAGSTRRPETA
jgi:surface carbohydrate biosynthesis protein